MYVDWKGKTIVDKNGKTIAGARFFRAKSSCGQDKVAPVELLKKVGKNGRLGENVTKKAVKKAVSDEKPQ
ncbi:MAG: hypothetical protein JST26_11760 [Bacteroidetes bacterium]|nr:hypothetical protein [Bacteroidota bacterium]